LISSEISRANMSITPSTAKVVILVKALPQPSKRYGETVCCAGVTADQRWKRLYPVRFRHLSVESSFSRWDWVTFRYRRPTSDTRPESCHVHEESLTVTGRLRLRERARFLNPLVRASAKHAALAGESLALIRPQNTRFHWKRKRAEDIEEERESYRAAARQTSMFDAELAELEPSPYEFRFRFRDDAGNHDYKNGDWEAHAMFRRERQRSDEQHALRWMDGVFIEEYPMRGMVFAIGNQAKRPQTWQLLGVIRLDEVDQDELPLHAL
jgi:hypothetical protein